MALRRAGFGALAAMSLGALAAAYWSQHHMDMQPCPWCILQRLLFIVIAALALAVALLPWSRLQKVCCALMTATAFTGVAAALWQHFVAAQSQSCALTLADRIISWTSFDVRWPEFFEVRASCADAAVPLWGIPYEFWSLALFALIGAWGLSHMLHRR